MPRYRVRLETIIEAADHEEARRFMFRDGHTISIVELRDAGQSTIMPNVTIKVPMPKGAKVPMQPPVTEAEIVWVTTRAMYLVHGEGKSAADAKAIIMQERASRPWEAGKHG